MRTSTASAGLDVETLEFTLEPIGDFATRERPDARLVELDEAIA